jgi:Fe-S-cluster-containing dehydrogenase component/DMSO reductase anchor subunit
MSHGPGIPSTSAADPADGHGIRTLLDVLIEDQRRLSAVERFSQRHAQGSLPAQARHYRDLIPLSAPAPGEQYAFQVDLDVCSGCKGCVTACHSLNGLDDNETWREIGFLVGTANPPPTGFHPAPGQPVIPLVQVVTTACHHCADPGCLNGCPVLAYEKDPQTGIVRHLDDQCIGCSYCILKCPYEVPKYSEARGIVRKCDLCQGRLTVGEAPACVQACPNEAIRITVVRTAAILAEHRPAGGSPSGSTGFLPDSPDPSITAPSTRYVTRQSVTDLQAADHAVPRREPAHWPLVVLLVFSQSAAGLALAAPAVALEPGNAPLRSVLGGAGVLLLLGLTASVLHLGQPLKAWRAFLGWRRSWLSREILALNLFAAALVAALAVAWIPVPAPMRWIGLGAAGASGLLAVLASAMVYIDTRRPVWNASATFLQFGGTTLLLGAAFTAFLLAGVGSSVPGIRSATLVALIVQALLLAWNHRGLRRGLENPGSSTHLNALAQHRFLPWIQPVRLGLFSLCVAAGLRVLLGPASGAFSGTAWMALVALASEILGRATFFMAGSARRMPGGIRP